MDKDIKFAGIAAIVIICFMMLASVVGFDRRHLQTECILAAPSIAIALLCRNYN